jgi:hypothetical protein
MSIVVINPFVLRQTLDSPFSCFVGDGGWDALLARVRAAFGSGSFRPGYRDGVIEVDIDPSGILSGVCTLTEGSELTGSFKARTAKEEPRKQVLAKGGKKIQAVSAYVALYRADVLKETNQNTLAADSGGWELVSINGNPSEGAMPIDPMTLLHNHFASSGGTATGMSDSELVAALRVSFPWWKDKAMCG